MVALDPCIAGLLPDVALGQSDRQHRGGRRVSSIPNGSMAAWRTSDADRRPLTIAGVATYRAFPREMRRVSGSVSAHRLRDDGRDWMKLSSNAIRSQTLALPRSWIVQQIDERRKGARSSTRPALPPTELTSDHPHPIRPGTARDLRSKRAPGAKNGGVSSAGGRLPFTSSVGVNVCLAEALAK